MNQSNDNTHIPKIIHFTNFFSINQKCFIINYYSVQNNEIL